jgi:hypothetical protein
MRGWLQETVLRVSSCGKTGVLAGAGRFSQKGSFLRDANDIDDARSVLWKPLPINPNRLPNSYRAPFWGDMQKTPFYRRKSAIFQDTPVGIAGRALGRQPIERIVGVGTAAVVG